MYIPQQQVPTASTDSKCQQQVPTASANSKGQQQVPTASANSECQRQVPTASTNRVSDLTFRVQGYVLSNKMRQLIENNGKQRNTFESRDRTNMMKHNFRSRK